MWICLDDNPKIRLGIELGLVFSIWWSDRVMGSSYTDHRIVTTGNEVGMGFIISSIFSTHGVIDRAHARSILHK